jgi:hypothetical protein
VATCAATLDVFADIGSDDGVAHAFREALALGRDLQSPVDQNHALEGLAACALVVEAAVPAASTSLRQAAANDESCGGRPSAPGPRHHIRRRAA